MQKVHPTSRTSGIQQFFSLREDFEIESTLSANLMIANLYKLEFTRESWTMPFAQQVTVIVIDDCTAEFGVQRDRYGKQRWRLGVASVWGMLEAGDNATTHITGQIEVNPAYQIQKSLQAVGIFVVILLIISIATAAWWYMAAMLPVLFIVCWRLPRLLRSQASLMRKQIEWAATPQRKKRKIS